MPSDPTPSPRGCLLVSKFVDVEFEAAAEGVYAEIGRPTLDLVAGWTIFGQMRGPHHKVYDHSVVY